MNRVDVDEMLDELTPGQFNEWRAFDSFEPIGDHRADWRNAQLICEVGRFIYGAIGDDFEVDGRRFMPFIFDQKTGDDDKDSGEIEQDIIEDDPHLIFARLSFFARR